MTAIAYRDGVMAGDGRVGDKHGDILSDTDVKVFKTKHYLLGTAGEAQSCQMLIEAVKGGYDPGKLRGINAMRVSKKGAIEIFEGRSWYPLHQTYAAIGVGATVAMAAMDLGFDAVKAVRAACKRNFSCGGKVRKVQW